MYDAPPPSSSSSARHDEDGDAIDDELGNIRRRIVLGINKYSHDASICAADANSGEVLFATSKERHTRNKNDGGDVANLVEMCLDELDADLDDVVGVVMNNHHHRILPHEGNVEHVEWESGLGINYGRHDDDGGGYADEYNLLSSIDDKIELSHHLAHAYCVSSQCPFDAGMIVIMDGMGETYRTMRRAIRDADDSYVSDLTLIASSSDGDSVVQFVPHDIEERAMYGIYDWREAESVYTFVKDRVGGRMIVKVSKSPR
jgi:predicted NodU family carbamoyl transferase